MTSKAVKPTPDYDVWLALSRLPPPKETFGRCRNATPRQRRCSTVPTILGDGYCQKCWDAGFPRQKEQKGVPRSKVGKR